MKIKKKKLSYKKVTALPAPKRFKPKRPSLLFRSVLAVASAPDLIATKFKCRKIGMEKLGKKEPCLILMNHSSFIDLKIAATILYPRPFNIICTSDGFVGKNWLMRELGCIPTNKFVMDTQLVRNMVHVTKKLGNSILMYPEASYSFDGTATPLPDSMGKILKLLGVPLVMIRTYGAFSRDPLYNNLQLRKVKVSADMIYVLSAEEIAEKSVDELNAILKDLFTFDNFRWQQENKVRIKEKFRADGLNRVLYKCPHCLAEGTTLGKGTELVCTNCSKKYTLTEYGELEAADGEAAFTHIPDWYNWERECVRKEIETGEYKLDVPVDIIMLVNSKAVYEVGSGRLTHSAEGFHLTGCDGQLEYHQNPAASYSLYADYFWYELGDIICIGDNKTLYYCFPKEGDVVAKTRLATEELFKMTTASRKKAK